MHSWMLRAAGIVLLVILISSAVYGAAPLKITDHVRGTTISFFNQYYIINQNGTLTLDNSGGISIYEFKAQLYLSTLSFEPEISDNVKYEGGVLMINQIPANSSISINYKLSGITTDSSLVYQKSALVTAMSKANPSINMQNVGTLSKAPLEDPSMGGNPNTRVISARYYNPASFDFVINDAEIIKTDSLDLSNQLNKWSFQKQNSILKPGEEWNIDIRDTDAHEGEIYWLKTDMSISGMDYAQKYNVTFLTEKDIYEIPENMTNATENLSEEVNFLIDRVYIRKTISKNLVVPGDELDVVLLINNFAPNDIKNISVKDVIPPGFEFVDTNGGKTDNLTIEFKNILVNPSETRRISYKLKYVDQDSFGLDFFSPAELYYNKKKIKSQSVPFVRKYIPESKVFLEKKIKFLDDDQNVKVTITLHNLGEAPVKHLVVNEYLSPDSEFKEVSREFTDKGVWKIDNISQGSSWETSYVTDVESVKNSFPVVYGVDSKSVMKTIILSNVVTSEYNSSKLRIIEIGGIISLLLIGILFFLPKDFFHFKKRSEVKQIKKIRSELSTLKAKTTVKKIPKDNKDKRPVAQSNVSSGGIPHGPVAYDKSKRDEIRESLKRQLNEARKDIGNAKKKV